MQNHEFSHKFYLLISTELNVNNVTKYLSETFTVVILLLLFCHLSLEKLLQQSFNYCRQKRKWQRFSFLRRHFRFSGKFQGEFRAQKMLNCAGNEVDNVLLTRGGVVEVCRLPLHFRLTAFPHYHFDLM